MLPLFLLNIFPPSEHSISRIGLFSCSADSSRYCCTDGTKTFNSINSNSQTWPSNPEGRFLNNNGSFQSQNQSSINIGRKNILSTAA